MSSKKPIELMPYHTIIVNDQYHHHPVTYIYIYVQIFVFTLNALHHTIFAYRLIVLSVLILIFFPLIAVYGPDGKRQNTRAVRYKERYTSERQDLLEKILELTNQQQASNGTVPSGMNGLPGSWSNTGNHIGGGLAGLLQYHKPTKKSEKIHIPVEKFPNYNFIGLIIGPRGKTQKELEAKTGCKIAIRGKGSVKEGARGRRDGSVDTADYEPLHVVVTGDDPRAVTAAATMIREMLIVIDDEKNVHKQQQLRELALLNGTLKDDNDGNSNAAMYCPICAEKGHRAFECPKRFNASSGGGGATSTVKCAICGDTSHPTRDCKLAPASNHHLPVPPPQNETNIDSEYQSFMAELDGKSTTTAVSTLPLPPPPGGDIVPPVLPPPPLVLLHSTLPPPPTAVTSTATGDGSIPNPVSLLPPPPVPPLPGPPTSLPLPPPPPQPAATSMYSGNSSSGPPPPVPYQYPPPPTQQPYYPHGQYPQQQQQQQAQGYNNYNNGAPGYAPLYGGPPPTPLSGVVEPTTTATTTMVQPGEETATWDPNAYYGANNNNTTSLNWWEQ